MAGGQGTRLGYKGPKGTYMLDLSPVKKSLFQIMAEDIKRNNEKYNTIIPWYIMTSDDNDLQTKKFFELNDFFEYPKEKIKFFKQDKLPLIDITGKLILQEPYLIKEASNGNGNVFKSLKANNIIKDLENNNIQWISFGGIDNILLKNFDPLFLGLIISHNLEIGSKSILKKEPLEKTAVYCKKDGKPAILDYDDINLELSESKLINTNTYLYREANMLSHIMSLEAIKKVSTIDLKYHRAYKKNSFVNFEGVKQVPDKPNTFKFENFIFDAFAYFDDMLLLRVDENEEFAPIKDFTGIYNPDTAIEKYNNYMDKQFSGLYKLNLSEFKDITEDTKQNVSDNRLIKRISSHIPLEILFSSYIYRNYFLFFINFILCFYSILFRQQFLLPSLKKHHLQQHLEQLPAYLLLLL